MFTTPGGVPNLVITGPLNITGVGDTPSRHKLFLCRPTSQGDETACARTILTTLARRAYRGPVSPGEIETLMEFYKRGRQSGDFDSGIQEALARVLVAPRFVYRAEEEPATIASGQPYRVSDIDLASRLSFFLWSSIPDDELIDAATKGRNDAINDAQYVVVVLKRHWHTVNLALAFHVHILGAVDHDFRYAVIFQQRLKRAEAEDFCRDLFEEPRSLRTRRCSTTSGATTSTSRRRTRQGTSPMRSTGRTTSCGSGSPTIESSGFPSRGTGRSGSTTPGRGG